MALVEDGALLGSRQLGMGNSGLDAPTAANLSLRGGHRESEAQSFRSDPLGGCSESEGSILCSRSRIRGTGNHPGFSARNAGQARNCVNYHPDGQANGRLPRGFWANPTQITCCDVATQPYRHLRWPPRRVPLPPPFGGHVPLEPVPCTWKEPRNRIARSDAACDPYPPDFSY